MEDGTPRLVAKRFAVPAGMIASVTPVPASASMHRCTLPSPPHTRTRSAPSFAASRRPLARLRALRHLVPHDLDAVALVEASSELGKPSADRLLAVGDDCNALHAKSLPSATLPRSRSHSATRKARCSAAITHDDAERGACDDVGDVVRAAVDAGEGDDQGDRDEREEPLQDHPRPVRVPQRGDQCERSVEGERRRDMTGRVARGRRDRVELEDIRTRASDHEVRRPGRW